MAKTDLAEAFNKVIAIGDLGTQLFWYNDNRFVEVTVTSETFASLKSSLYIYDNGEYTKLGNSATYDSSEDYYQQQNAFEYALPVVAGAEFGGDTETLEAPESDDPTVAKISGRTTLSDVTYNANYNKTRYERLFEILDVKNVQTYMEVFSDGSAMVFSGTAGQPTIQSGDVRQIEFTIAPQNEYWIKDISSLTEDEIELIEPLLEGASLSSGSALPFDLDSIPAGRVGFTEENITE